MKNLLFVILLFSGSALTQNNVQLRNALVIGQMDNPEDRYSMEINLVELLTENGVKAKPSLNYVKVGQDAAILASDSLQQVLKSQGIDTYVLVTVRGFDRRYKLSSGQELKKALDAGNLFRLYRDGAVSVSFEFSFYRNGIFVGSDIIKCGNISDRDSVIKRFRKKVSKRIVKKWMK